MMMICKASMSISYHSMFMLIVLAEVTENVHQFLTMMTAKQNATAASCVLKVESM